MDGLRTTAEQVVRRATQMGATAADAFIREEETFSVTVRMGEVEKLKEAVSHGLRLRVFLGKKTAISQSSDLTPAIVEKLVDETVEMARLTSEDQSGGLPDPSVFQSEFPDLQLADASWDDLKPRERIEWARRAEAAALQADRSITNSEGGSFDYARSRTVLANTLGFIGRYEGTEASVAAVPIAQSPAGMQRDYWVSVARHRDRMESPEDVGRRAAERAVRRVGARKVRTCRVPIIFDPLTARTLLGHIFQAVAGDAVYRRASCLVDQIGQNVAAPMVTILDDARLIGGLGSSPFDDEGVPTQTTPIIEDGVLRNYLHSAYTARKLHSKPTGNGSRSGAGSVSVGRGPHAFDLAAPVPNPASRQDDLSFALAQRSRVRLRLFTVGGQAVRTLIDAELDAGLHHATWDGRDERARPAAPGVYFVRLDGAAATRIRRLVWRP